MTRFSCHQTSLCSCAFTFSFCVCAKAARTCAHVVYSTAQWSDFSWGTSYIILTMYSVVNKKVSGWGLAPCNNKMHELSTAGPSVSIVPLNAVRKKHMWAAVIDSTVCMCVHVQRVCVQSVFMGHRCETPYNNRYTCSIVIDCTFISFCPLPHFDKCLLLQQHSPLKAHREPRFCF